MSGVHKTSYGYTAFLNEPWIHGLNAIPTELAKQWESDGIFVKAMLLGPTNNRRLVQLVCETDPQVSPVFLAQRLKGRLQYALKQESALFPGFTRDFHLISLGGNDRTIVSDYIREQVNHSDLVDPLYRKRMNDLRFEQVPSSPPSGKHKGIHDLALHVVFVIAGRARMFSNEARTVADALLQAVSESSGTVHGFSIMPDHAHLLIRPNHHLSPQETIKSIREASHKKLRRTAFWQQGGYTGTVGPYRLEVALRKTKERGGWVCCF